MSGGEHRLEAMSLMEQENAVERELIKHKVIGKPRSNLRATSPRQVHPSKASGHQNHRQRYRQARNERVVTRSARQPTSFNPSSATPPLRSSITSPPLTLSQILLRPYQYDRRQQL